MLRPLVRMESDHIETLILRQVESSGSAGDLFRSHMEDFP